MDKILIVDDESFIRENLERVLTADGYHTIAAENTKEAKNAVAHQDVDLVLLDLNLGSESGLDLLRDLKENDPELLVIIITGYGTVESAVDALKLGAYDYIKKPFKADAIHLIVRLALETQSLKREVRHLKREGKSFLSETKMIGNSPQMLKVFQNIQEIAKHELSTVLITGESGTGKELAARAIHNLSPRKNQPFVDVNCGSLPFNLLEAELFGYEKGAFTDAKARKIGLIEEANGGTLFLDEIGEMDINIQVKLLRVIEDKKIRRLGGTRTLDVNIRIISATNRNLQKAIETKDFREDLYYRLNVVPIQLPPLRERRGDVAQMLEFYLKKYNLEFNKNIKNIDSAALSKLLIYNWPGNARELKNVVERICIMNNKDSIDLSMLPTEISGNSNNSQIVIPEFTITSEGLDLEKAVSQVEKMLIFQAYEFTDRNVAKTSRLLNIPRGTLRYKIDKYELKNIK